MVCNCTMVTSIKIPIGLRERIVETTGKTMGSFLVATAIEKLEILEKAKTHSA